jgi:hypothetical protein
MAKNYLQHDYFSRSTPVLLKIRAKYGMAGLGVYWCLAEKIHECDGQLDYDVELLAYEFGTDVEQIKGVVEQAFAVIDNMITAEWIIDNLAERSKKSEQGTKAGQASGKVRRANSKLNKLKESTQQVFNRKGTDVEEDKIIEDKLREVKLSKANISEDIVSSSRSLIQEKAKFFTQKQNKYDSAF